MRLKVRIPRCFVPEKWLEEFEAAWLSGSIPRIEDFLASPDLQLRGDLEAGETSDEAAAGYSAVAAGSSAGSGGDIGQDADEGSEATISDAGGGSGDAVSHQESEVRNQKSGGIKPRRAVI